ncbi:MAG: hypothetical protein ACXADC_15245 [Candidatus Thorarchaeota archaeon]
MSAEINPGWKIGGIMGLAFCLPLVFVLILFQFLGIAEYVFPIIIPIFIGTVLLFFFIFGVIMIAVRSATRRTTRVGQAYTRSYEASLVSGSDYMAEYPPGASYEIPVYCPYCQESIELDSVQWIGSGGLVCSNCHNQVRVEVSEE